MHLIFLSQENIGLSRLEAQSLLELKVSSLDNEILFANILKKNINRILRLAYTKRVLELLFMCNVKDLAAALESYDFSEHYKQSFCLRIHVSNSSATFDEKDYAKFVWRSIGSRHEPRVDLNNPQLLVEILINKNTAMVCKQIWRNEENFERRKAHHMPQLHPTAMHPRMARALVNIVNAKKIIDPFCGAGGIIQEAALMGVRCIGYDIDDIQIRRAKINLSGLKGFEIKKGDATALPNLSYVVTDLPYGKSSKSSAEINSLYASFIKNIKGRSVVVFPDFSDYRKILKDNLSSSVHVTHVIDHYVHKSLTRKIILIESKEEKNPDKKQTRQKRITYKTKRADKNKGHQKNLYDPKKN